MVKVRLKSVQDPEVRMTIDHKQVSPNILSHFQISIHADFLNRGSMNQGSLGSDSEVPTRGDFAYQGTFDNTWRPFWLS